MGFDLGGEYDPALQVRGTLSFTVIPGKNTVASSGKEYSLPSQICPMTRQSVVILIADSDRGRDDVDTDQSHNQRERPQPPEKVRTVRLYCRGPGRIALLQLPGRSVTVIAVLSGGSRASNRHPQVAGAGL